MPAPKGNKNAEGNTGGRPTKYKAQYAQEVYDLALLGLTDKEIGKYFDVSENAINSWKKQHVEFRESLKRGKVIADTKVAMSLYRRALGYSYDEVTFEKIDNKVNLEITTAGEIKQDDTYKKKIVTKEMPPDVTAQIFWLKNRQKELWKDRHHLRGSLDVKNLLDPLPESEIDRIIGKITNKNK